MQHSGRSLMTQRWLGAGAGVLGIRGAGILLMEFTKCNRLLRRHLSLVQQR